MIHTVKGFGIINKAEVDVFLELSCFFQRVAIWSLVPLPFLNPAWTSGSSRFTYCWSLAWRILSITLDIFIAIIFSYNMFHMFILSIISWKEGLSFNLILLLSLICGYPFCVLFKKYLPMQGYEKIRILAGFIKYFDVVSIAF